MTCDNDSFSLPSPSLPPLFYHHLLCSWVLLLLWDVVIRMQQTGEFNSAAESSDFRPATTSISRVFAVITAHCTQRWEAGSRARCICLCSVDTWSQLFFCCEAQGVIRHGGAGGLFNNMRIRGHRQFDHSAFGGLPLQGYSYSITCASSRDGRRESLLKHHISAKMITFKTMFDIGWLPLDSVLLCCNIHFVL
jgi:hypothetical protein